MILEYVGEVACRASIGAKTNSQSQLLILSRVECRTETSRTTKFNDRIHSAEVIILSRFI